MRAVHQMFLQKRRIEIGKILTAQSRESIACATIDLPVLVDQFKEDLHRADGLSLPEKEIANGRKRESKLVQDIFLEFGSKVNQDVAAKHQVNAWKGRAAAEILLPKNHHLSQGFGDAIAMIDTLEKSLPVIVGNAFQ